MSLRAQHLYDIFVMHKFRQQLCWWSLVRNHKKRYDNIVCILKVNPRKQFLNVRPMFGGKGLSTNRRDNTISIKLAGYKGSDTQQ
jgi:hypothetical protein